MDYQITHIIPDSADPDRRIDAVYGPTCGLLYEDTAIRNIDWGINSYYTMAYWPVSGGCLRGHQCLRNSIPNDFPRRHWHQ
jgi:hypothetical protein